MEDNKSHFLFFWEKVIQPVIEQVKDGIDDPKILDNLKINVSKSYLNTLCHCYRKHREIFKHEWYGRKLTKDSLLDLHKLGAVVCYSLIQHKPFVFDEEYATTMINNFTGDNVECLVNNYLINYKVAFLSAMGISYIGLLDSEILKNTIEELKALHGLKKYNNPENGHTNFENTMILHLAKQDLQNKDIDLNFLSMNLYQWEEYTKLYVQ